jgi:hypothetical protein
VDDPELTNLTARLVRLIAAMPAEYQPLLSLPMYLARPATAPVAVALLEIADPAVSHYFEMEIMANVSGLLSAPPLVELLTAFLARTTRECRGTVYQHLSSRFEEYTMSTWTWRLIYMMICVGTMPQRLCLARIVAGVVNKGFLSPYIDELLVHALDCVDAKTRIQLMGEVGPVAMEQNFPLYSDYLISLSKILSAGDAK